MKNQNNKKNEFMEIKGSFRDPSGSLFTKNGILYRKIMPVYSEHYEHAKKSGLYDALIKEGLLVSHRETGSVEIEDKDAYKIIIPQRIPFISYPYEWCFSQLKDAALLTLKIQKIALDFGMILKDASAFNVQFWQGKPIFIDTLSFEKYKEGYPWVGYRQFCQHFFAPLLLMKYRDLRMNQLLRIFIDGVPLDLASKLLPLKTFFVPAILSHIHLHAKSQKKFSERKKAINWQISKRNLVALIDNMDSAVHHLAFKLQKTEWGDYYEKTNYSDKAFKEKAKIVDEFLTALNSRTAWDLGANIGEFSRSASEKGIETMAFDIDPVAIEKNYLEVKEKNEQNLLPLLMDFTNPSSELGWANEERLSIAERGPADVILALALLHHLAISNNLPLRRIAEYLSGLCEYLIIEFVPKTDSQVKKLLATREDVFPHYHQEGFEEEFGKYFIIEQKKNILDSERYLYLMHKKSHD